MSYAKQPDQMREVARKMSAIILICPRCGGSATPPPYRKCEDHRPIKRGDLFGTLVVYQPSWLTPQEGIVTSVNDTYAFVCYRFGTDSKATNPGDLVTAAGGVRLTKWWP